MALNQSYKNLTKKTDNIVLTTVSDDVREKVLEEEEEKEDNKEQELYTENRRSQIVNVTVVRNVKWNLRTKGFAEEEVELPICRI